MSRPPEDPWSYLPTWMAAAMVSFWPLLVWHGTAGGYIEAGWLAFVVLGAITVSGIIQGWKDGPK